MGFPNSIFSSSSERINHLTLSEVMQPLNHHYLKKIIFLFGPSLARFFRKKWLCFGQLLLLLSPPSLLLYLNPGLEHLELYQLVQIKAPQLLLLLIELAYKLFPIPQLDKYFSPNNDGINDTWQILGLKTTFNSLSNVYIYDRYGRFLKQLSGDEGFWDGNYQGKPLPSDDYWFRLELEDGRVYTGHFSLIR